MDALTVTDQTPIRALRIRGVRNRGNHASGADISRPSSRITRIEAPTNSTLSAWTLSRFAKMGMPSLQELVTVLDNCRGEPRQFAGSKSTRPRQLYGFEPRLGRSVPAFDMNVRRLGVAEEHRWTSGGKRCSRKIT